MAEKAQSYFEREKFKGTVNKQPSLTKQAFSKEADIDYILKKYEQTGVPPSAPVGQMMAGDFSSVPSYQNALNAVLRAEENFMTLPAKIRSRFNNDPAELLAFCLNPKNRKEAEELGIVEKKEQVTPAPKPNDAKPEIKPGEPKKE